MANEKEVKAQVKLRFRAANGVEMLAVRNLSVTMKKTSGMTMKTLESILALAHGNAEKGGKVRLLASHVSPISKWCTSTEGRYIYQMR
jgi:DNA repair protein RAD50